MVTFSFCKIMSLIGQVKRSKSERAKVRDGARDRRSHRNESGALQVRMFQWLRLRRARSISAPGAMASDDKYAFWSSLFAASNGSLSKQIMEGLVVVVDHSTTTTLAVQHSPTLPSRLILTLHHCNAKVDSHQIITRFNLSLAVALILFLSDEHHSSKGRRGKSGEDNDLPVSWLMQTLAVTSSVLIIRGKEHPFPRPYRSCMPFKAH